VYRIVNDIRDGKYGHESFRHRLSTLLVEETKNEPKVQIVINNCYGGYSLSEKYINWKKCEWLSREEVAKDMVAFGRDIVTEDNNIEKIGKMISFQLNGPRGISEEINDNIPIFDKNKNIYESFAKFIYEDMEQNEITNEVYQFIGLYFAGGEYSNLIIKEYNPFVGYTIDDYDGLETLTEL